MPHCRTTIARRICGAGNLLARLLAAFVFLGTFATPGLAQEAKALPDPTGDVILSVSGDISRTNRGDEAVFDRRMLGTLPHHVLKTHTVVTDGENTFEGFLMTDLLDWVGADGDTVTASALNDYVIDIPMGDFARFHVLVATKMDGKTLTARDKGPLWIVYPRDDYRTLQDLRYDYRWVWQLNRLVVK